MRNENRQWTHQEIKCQEHCFNYIYVQIIQIFTPFLLTICTRLRFFIYGGNIYILLQVHDTKLLLRRLIDLFSYSMAWIFHQFGCYYDTITKLHREYGRAEGRLMIVSNPQLFRSNQNYSCTFANVVVVCLNYS